LANFSVSEIVAWLQGKAPMLAQLAEAPGGETVRAETSRVDLRPIPANGNAPAVALIAEERSPIRGIALAMLLSLPVWVVLGVVLLLVY
jgi:hypothetical protein